MFFVGKLYFIFHQGGVIPNEIIGPQSHISKPSTQLLLKEILTVPSSEILNNCSLPARKQMSYENESSYLFSEAHKFNAEKSGWLSMNDFSLGPFNTRRGGFIHHYSTILYPFRELTSGNWKEALTSQYGFVSILPLIILKNRSPFTRYQFWSLFLLLPLFFLTLKTLRILECNSPLELPLFLTLIALICLDEAGLLISPGFSLYRFLPFVLLFRLILIFLARNKLSRFQWVTFPLLLLANSAPFNIFVVALLFVAGAFEVRRKKKRNVQLFLLFALTTAVILFQFLILLDTKNIFTPTFFGSLKDSNVKFSWLYSCVLILPYFLSAILRSCFSDNPISVLEFLSYTAVGLCLTYCLSFPGSPMHYFGFLVLTALPQVIIFSPLVTKVKLQRIPWTIRTLLTILLCLPTYKYRKIPSSQVPCNASYLSPASYGRKLVFTSSWNLKKLDDDLTVFLDSFKLRIDDIALLTKDKGFIELYRDKNLEPKSYDSYLNTDSSLGPKLVEDFKRKQILHFIIDSPTQSKGVSDAIDFFSRRSGDISVNNDAYAYHDLLETHQSFARLNYVTQLGCTPRWCLYSIKQ
ncbi:MAG: hypothetical protein FJZ63_06345 [Chlamydiae bacterium]|nr:hypothetical protein [Chlamydiota bacterium]